MLASLSCGLNSPPLPLAEQFPLKFGQASHHGEYQTTGSRGGVDAEIENPEMHAAPLQVIDQQQNIRRGAPEATHFRNGERVTEPKTFNQLIEKRSLPDAGSSLDHDGDRTGTAEGINLSILGLIGGRNAGIPDEIA